MSITFPNVFANSAGGNQPASELDVNFTYCTTLASVAPPAGGLSGSELVLLYQGGNPVSSTITQFAASIGIGLAAQAVILQTGQTFSVSGDATGTSSAFNGSAGCIIPITLVTATTGVAGKVPLATGAQVVAGSDSSHAVTPASLTSAQLASANGYVTLPGGIIIQWGSLTATQNGTGTFSFPTAFTTAVYSIVGTPTATSGTNSTFTITNTNLTTGSYNWPSAGGGTHVINWMAIGK